MASKKVIEIAAADLSPHQGAMLQLCGYVVMRGGISKAGTDDQFMKAMREGRSMLMSLTGQDLGFRLSRWNRYLLENHYDTYHRNDTWKYVKALLQLAGKDEVRPMLVKRLDRQDEADAGGRSTNTVSMARLATASVEKLEEKKNGSDEVAIRYTDEEPEPALLDATSNSEPFDPYDVSETPEFDIDLKNNEL